MSDDIRYRDREIDPRLAWHEGVKPMPVMPKRPKTAAAKIASKVFEPPRALPEEITVRGAETTKRVMAEERREIDRRFEPSFGDAVSGAFGQTVVGSLVDRVLDEIEGQKGDERPEPGFRVDPSYLDGLAEDEQRWVAQSKNRRQLDFRRGSVGLRRKEMQSLFHKGVTGGLALTMGVSVPESLLAANAFNASRSMLRGFRAAEGAKAAKALSAWETVQGGIIGNAAVTAAQAAYDPFTGVQDVLFAGALGGLVSIPGGIRNARRLDGREGSLEATAKDMEVKADVLKGRDIEVRDDVKDIAAADLKAEDEAVAAAQKAEPGKPKQEPSEAKQPARPDDESPADHVEPQSPQKPDLVIEADQWHEGPRSAFPKDAEATTAAPDAEDAVIVDKAVEPRADEAVAEQTSAPEEPVPEETPATAGDSKPQEAIEPPDVETPKETAEAPVGPENEPLTPDEIEARQQEAGNAPHVGVEKPETAAPAKAADDQPAVREGVTNEGLPTREETIPTTEAPKSTQPPTTNDMGDTVVPPETVRVDVDAIREPVAEVTPAERSKDAAIRAATGTDPEPKKPDGQPKYNGIRHWANVVGIGANNLVVKRRVYHTSDVPDEAVKIANDIVDTFLPGERVAVISGSPKNNASGLSLSVNRKAGAVFVDFSEPQWRMTLAHEMGHIVLMRAMANQFISASTRDEFLAFWRNLQAATNRKVTKDQAMNFMAARFDTSDPRLIAGMEMVNQLPDGPVNVMDVLTRMTHGGDERARSYLMGLHEIGADQFVKYYNRSGVLDEGWPKLTKAVASYFANIYNRVVEYWKKAAAIVGKEHVPADPRKLWQEMEEKAKQRKAAFYDDRREIPSTRDYGLDHRPDPDAPEPTPKKRGRPKKVDPAALKLDEAEMHHLETFPFEPVTTGEYGIERGSKTVAGRTAAAAGRFFHAKATAAAIPRVLLSKLHQKIQGNPETIANDLVSASAIMAGSKNEILRWFGWAAAESPTGTSGPRHVTAAIKQYNLRNEIAGNDLHALDAAKDAWLKSQGVTMWRRVFDIEEQKKFNRALSDALIEAQRGRMPQDPAMQAAVKALNEIGKRIAEVETKYLGVKNSRAGDMGYMPQRLDSHAVAGLTIAQRGVLRRLMAQSLIGQNGLDAKAAEAIADAHIRTAARQRATPFGVNLNEIDPESLKGIVSGDVAQRLRFDIPLDARLDHDLRVIDIMQNDHYGIANHRASSTAGWAALSELGVRDQRSANLLREAIISGKGEHIATDKEIAAFDQVVAELTGGKFGDAGDNKAIAAASTLTAVVRLGGLIFNTVGEIINLGAHIGYSRTLAYFPQIRQLRKELLAIRDGKPIENGLLSSMEKRYGSHFGAEGYLLVSPWDRPGLRNEIGGIADSGTIMRALQGAGHAQGVLTGVRAVQMTATRFAAQDITRAALQYAAKSANNPKMQRVMADIGLSPEWLDRYRADLHAATRWKGGQAVGFDINKLPPEAADHFQAAIWRAAKQIIQGTFAGESGAWVHKDAARVFLQMKTFAINSIEKQQMRYWHNHGAMNFALMFMTSMAMAMPIHLMRVGWNALGRPEDERKEYLDNALSPTSLFTSTMTYMAASGVLPDAIQALTTLVGVDSYNQALIGGSFLPAADMLNDIYNVGASPAKATKVMPLLNAAPIIPFMNAIRAPLKEAEEDIRDN